LDATGIAIINEDIPGAPTSVVFKKALRPVRFVERPLYQELVETRIGPSTDYILLHARATTVGGTYNNFNNHPIVTERMVTIHNGTLWNDDTLFKDYKLPREGTVDSEVIPRLYEEFIDRGRSPRDAMIQTGSELGGAFTGAIIDREQPQQMVMFKNDRSLCLFFIPHYDVVIAVSEARFFANAARRLNLRAKGSSVFVEDGTGLFFDLENGGRITDTVEDFEIPRPKTRERFPAGHAWMSCD
jgi:glucosamine 6-phosphate synthetase-like amidotransferase/phosphosugar isomerase protein